MNAAACIANADHAAYEWARAQATRIMVRAAMDSHAVVYRRTWPSPEATDLPCGAGYDPKLACDGRHHSTLDLRDGLSVVEVFASLEESPALPAFAALRHR